MPVFYATKFDGKTAILGEEESRHLVRVLRLRPDDPVDLVDGMGTRYSGIISSADPRAARVNIQNTSLDYRARNYTLHIAIAPTKSTERFEWFLEKATEIGVDEITPVVCERSERRKIRQERSEKIIISAMKQSGRASLPKLNPIISLSVLMQNARADYKFIAHCMAEPGPFPAGSLIPDRKWLVLIGPEGDFTPEEVANATLHNFVEMNLGEAVYRTETAGVLACHQINLLSRSV